MSSFGANAKPLPRRAAVPTWRHKHDTTNDDDDTTRRRPTRSADASRPSKAQRLLVTIRRGHVAELAFGGDLIGAVVLALAARPLGHRGRLPLALLDLVFGHTLVLHPFAAAVLCTGSAPCVIVVYGWPVLHRCSLVGHRPSFLRPAFAEAVAA